MKTIKTAAAATVFFAALATGTQAPRAQPGEARWTAVAWREPEVRAAAASVERVITLKKGDTLEALAKAHGVSVDDLAKANGLSPPYRVTAGDELKLPGKAPAKPAAAKPAAKASGDTVTVAKGDTLASISKKTGVPVEALAAVNGLDKPYKLKLGQTLKLEGAVAAKGEGDKAAGEKAASSTAEPAKAGGQVKVGKHDTLAAIAKRAGVSVEDLAQLNGLSKPYRLKPGQTLKLGEGAAQPAAKASKAPEESSAKDDGGQGSVVTVRRHDTLQSLAKGAGVSADALARLNGLQKPYRVHRGQKIRLPGGAMATAGGEAAPAGPQEASIKAGRHDTLKSIAAKVGVPVETLAKLNGIRRPYRIHRGQVIRVPSVPADYTVQSGDSLYSIARRFGTDAKALADLNKLDPGDALKVGRKIALPGEAQDRIAPRERRAPLPIQTLPTPAVQPPAPEVPVTSAGGAAASDATPANAGGAPASASQGQFAWPVRGEILSSFGPKAGTQTNDGVDIASRDGDPVRAAAGGEVAYSGNSVPGFGNLVLIRHAGGWVTAYAHLGSIAVKMRQMVIQGQEIGQIGKSEAGVPELHFEMRYAPSVNERARPIDPLTMLPK